MSPSALTSSTPGSAARAPPAPSQGITSLLEAPGFRVLRWRPAMLRGLRVSGHWHSRRRSHPHTFLASYVRRWEPPIVLQSSGMTTEPWRGPWTKGRTPGASRGAPAATACRGCSSLFELWLSKRCPQIKARKSTLTLCKGVQDQHQTGRWMPVMCQHMSPKPSEQVPTSGWPALPPAPC